MATPRFIVGTGRCGSSLAFKVMALHPQVSHFTGILNHLPNSFVLNKGIVALKKPRLFRSISRKKLPPSEAWQFWHHHIPGFNQPYRDLKSEDVTNVVRKRFSQIIRSNISRRRPYILIKFTGWTRVGFIKEIYPDAPIVHIVRNPRAVAQSFLQVPWWDGWRGPSRWRWGDLSSEENRVWKDSGESFIVLAAINWKKIMESYWLSKQRLPEGQKKSVIEKNYSKICEDPVEEIDVIRRHFGLEVDNGFLKRVERYDIRTQDEKWRKVFTPGQIERLEAALEDLRWKDLMEGRIDPESPMQEVIA